ncbi:hypothetical protein [Fervidibacter sacchari]
MEGRRQWLKKFLGGVFGAFGITSGAAALNRGLTDEEAKQIAGSVKGDGEDLSNQCPQCQGFYCNTHCNFCPQCQVGHCPNYSPGGPCPNSHLSLSAK